MKSVLMTLLLLVVVSSASARRIPADSLNSYLEKSVSVLTAHRDNFVKIWETHESDHSLRELVMIIKYDLQMSIVAVENIQVYFQISEICQEEISCDGIGFNVVYLNHYLDQIQKLISVADHQLTVIQGNEAKKSIEELLRNIIDSISNEECRAWILRHFE